MSNLFISNTDELDVKNLFRSDDMLISLGDIAFGGAAVAGGGFSSERFAVNIASLGHILTRIVLSERLVFVDNPEGGIGPIDDLLPLLKSHCNTLVIDERHPLVRDITSVGLKNPTGTFGEQLVTDMHQRVTRYVPGSSENLTSAWLSEYAISEAMNVPFAPNPYLSQSFRRHELPATIAAEHLVFYLEGLRRKTAEDVNLLSKLNIFDLRLPAIFGAILRESNTPNDLVRVASQMNAHGKQFRAWCRNLGSKFRDDPQTYLDQLGAAQESLDRLGRSLRAKTGDRMEVSVPIVEGLGVKLPAPTLKKVVDWLNVDFRFRRPRHFLLNVLSSARQVRSLTEELARVFRVKIDYAKEGVDHYFNLASDLEGETESAKLPANKRIQQTPDDGAAD